MQLGRFTLAKGASLAPMAGATDTTMRRLCAAHGAVCTVSEMVSAKALTMGDKKSPRLMAGGGGDAPFGVQLFGAQPDVMAEAARLICDMRGKMPFDFIDINMGCPAPKIAGPGAGSALLKDPLAGPLPDRAGRGAGRCARYGEAAHRLGRRHDDGPEVARRCAAGAALLTVHGRTRAEMYNPGIHPEEIAKIKAAVDIPVLANGDVTDAESALALLAATGCDGVAVGRGAMGNPWLFGQIAAAMECREVPPPPSLHERFRVLRRHIYDMCEDKGEYIAMQQARTHAAWYMHGLRGAATLRRECCGMLHFTDLDRVIEHAWELQRETR
ncbi:MAG: tRNA dihydrouridine synthase [Ruthenibacterium lactatiformans]|uniref:tRNA dihydrouridine synthase n=1 Tax=Ruthenibacterium lactatiformans TaxID=1550024 RepID=UPI003990E489